jgi:hypothetical protein
MDDSGKRAGKQMMKLWLGKWTFGVICGFILLGTANAAEPNPLAQAAVQIERVALFENGLGYFVSIGSLPERETTIRIGQLPVLVYGTFWVGFSDDVKLKRLVTALEEVASGSMSTRFIFDLEEVDCPLARNPRRIQTRFVVVTHR